MLQIAGKQAALGGVAEFYQSLVCKANKNIGEEISRLQVWKFASLLYSYIENCVLQRASELFKAAQSRAGKTLFGELVTKVDRNLVEARKDNDFIYHERIPDIKSVEPIGKAQPAKVLQVAHPMSQNFKGK